MHRDASAAKSLFVDAADETYRAHLAGSRADARNQDAEIMLDHHQAGEHVEGLYLQVAVTGSSWHVFARIAIQRL